MEGAVKKKRKRRPKGSCTWYVEAANAHTNEVIARQLSDASLEEQGALCADGKRRDLWRCDYPFIEKLWESKDNLQVNFTPFNQYGNGAIRSWPFLRNRKKAVAARRRLDDIRARHAGAGASQV